jgi:riboflavin kinase / FMN adenylyltransferase
MPIGSQTAPLSALTIGAFDGVHRGHAALVRAARQAAGDAGRVIALSFDPHPLSLLRPEHVPPRLSTFEQRREWLTDLGADDVQRIEPTREFLSQSPEQFIDWLVERYQPSVIVEGPDFRFGRGRAGSIDTLRQHESRCGYRTIVIEPVEVALSDQNIVTASSTITRWLISHGRMQDAARVLGRPYEIRCPVIEGDRRGRLFGVPTANLGHGEYLLPADGVYAGFAHLPDRGGRTSRPRAAISVGTKPTFGDHPRVCEAHLIDYDGPLDHYGWTISLQFHCWLRDQLIYADVNQLREQVERDVAAASAFAAEHECHA